MLGLSHQFTFLLSLIELFSPGDVNQVAAAFARLFSSSAAGGTHHDKSSVTPPPFLGFRFDQVVRRSLLQLLPNTSDLKEGDLLIICFHRYFIFYLWY